MSLILNLDTATETASVCLSFQEKILAYSEHNNQKEHALFLHKAIEQVMKTARKLLKEVDAISVSAGPGSYTGLRVSMAAAKGLCFALDKPLICINTLKVMACAAKQIYGNGLFCPMIDARRMEVFTALYNEELEELVTTAPVFISESFLEEYRSEKVVFIGSGIHKFQSLTNNTNFVFDYGHSDARNLAQLSNEYYKKRLFSDVAYEEPFYSKDFYTPK